MSKLKTVKGEPYFIDTNGDKYIAVLRYGVVLLRSVRQDGNIQDVYFAEEDIKKVRKILKRAAKL